MPGWKAASGLPLPGTFIKEGMYKEYCDIIHAAGKFVFFHSDGHTEAIYDDLTEVGVDVYNSQLFCMDMRKT